MTRPAYPCADFGVDILEIYESYMVRNAVWQAAGMAPNGGRLCVGCLEQRLGRRLTDADFTAVPANDARHKYMSRRLWNRINGSRLRRLNPEFFRKMRVP
jgi:hypothetical protein